MAEVEQEPTRRWRDRDLRAISVDPTRARRYFNEHYGMTFQAYSRSRRMGIALGQIREGGKLTEVAMKHGYESNSGFRDAFEKVFGRPPGKSRTAGCIVSTIVESSIGSLLLGATDEALCLLEFPDRRALETQLATLRKRFENPIVPGTNKWIEQAIDELGQYFEGKLKRFRVPIVYPGTPFQQTVWDRLRGIPYGETISYARLAKDVGRAGAQRAVGTANGKNRLAIIIPCHRVVNKDGKLGGYGGGLWRKQFLLDLERGIRKNGLF